MSKMRGPGHQDNRSLLGSSPCLLQASLRQAAELLNNGNTVGGDALQSGHSGVLPLAIILE
jgi:hypothetical protein